MPLRIYILALGMWLALPLAAQRAQLGIKGRRAETGAPKPETPIRTLPRRRASPPPVFGPSPLDVFIQKQRAALPPPRSLPEDRSRALPRRIPILDPPAPLTTPVEVASLNPLPRRGDETGSLEGLLPSFVVPGPIREEPVPNRWRVQFPAWQRYDDTGLDTVYAKESRWDPFNRNVLKGDYPLWGRRGFLSFQGSSDTLFEARRINVPSSASGARPNEPEFFGKGEQFIFRENLRFSFDLFRGSAGFQPVDYELRITPEFQINYVSVRENSLTRIDVREGTKRTDTNLGIQELFFEKRLGTNSRSMLRGFRPRDSRNPDDRGSAYYDFTSLRLGIQRFTSDFRGFIFSDEQPGVRLFGTFGSNRYQYNLAYFNMLEKDTNSGLNRARIRNQSVYVANVYWQDFLTLGYNLNFSALYNNDQPTFHIDKNGFIVRPAPIGDPRPHKIRAGYVGITGDGHIGRINVSNAFYQAFGRDDFNPIPAMKNPQHINAQLAALEIAYERDWLIYKASAFFTSGDGDINDGRAKGFDGIVPNQQFAGGGFLGNNALADRGLINPLFEGGGTNFLNRQPFPLTGTGLLLFGPNSLMPTARSSPFQGQANFINPGVLLFNVGVDAKLTPKLRTQVNANYLRFHRTGFLEAVLFQSGIRHSIGTDVGFGVQYRPWLSENFVVTGGFGVLLPHEGFKNIYSGRTLYSGFVLTRFLF